MRLRRCSTSRRPNGTEFGPTVDDTLRSRTYLVTVGKDTDLNKAMDNASWAMIELLQKQKGLTRLDAYGLASLVMDCRLPAPVAAESAVHCLLPKSTWVGRR